MRYIAIFLILANLAFLAWRQILPSADEISRPQARPLLNTGLALVSEYEAESALLAEEAATAARLCAVFTGFPSVGEAHSFMQQAENRGLQANLGLTGNALPSQYRVFLPPASSAGVAAVTLDGLEERLSEEELLVEVYLITRGPLENAVALGVFAEREAAEAVQEGVTGLGYQPRIEEIPRSDGDILVWLDRPLSELPEAPEWLDFSAETATLERSENLCETIAQASRIP